MSMFYYRIASILPQLRPHTLHRNKEIVMVAYGRAARLAVGKEDSSIEAAVIGIIDEYDVTPGHYHGDLDPARIKHKKSVHEE